ncbi:hypothetical protein A2U01_0056252 [Trifolium medium]|uniref:Uncharacterized protein n=1 Tax=Trifolium medium TaxID=97028 RepID=A0A392REN1_9FABA|nr:hypothetical protein [Trifolium medium]
MDETDFSTLNAQILHNFPYRRAAPSVLRDAQLAVTLINLNFCNGAPRQTILRDAQLPEDHLGIPDSTVRRAIPGCATRKGQREFLL